MQVERQPEVPIKHTYEIHAEGARTPEESAVVEAVQTPLKEIAKTKFYDFTGNAFMSFLRKAARFLDFTKYLGGALNSNTIIRGTLKNWDPERLKAGKHRILQEFGAKSLEFTSKTHEKVGAHYIDAVEFLKKIKEKGGERKVLKFDLPDESFFNEAKVVRLKVSDNLPISMHELKLAEDFAASVNDLKRLEFTLETFGKKLVKDETTGKFYAIGRTDFSQLLKTNYFTPNSELQEEGTFKDFDLEPEFKIDSDFLGVKQTTSAIIFEREAWDKLEEESEFETILTTSGWESYYAGDKVYLVPLRSIPVVDMFFNPKRAKDSEMTLDIADAAPLEKAKGTILLTQNQSDIYEQHLPEIFTYALEGMNVLAYNNPGKGLSTGLADNSNINASIDAAYEYLHKIKKIKDRDILAKGQCFGAAPTAWLGRQHPKINLMMDQNPANFHEMAMDEINKFCYKLIGEDLNDRKEALELNEGRVNRLNNPEITPSEEVSQKPDNKYQSLRKWAPYILKLNFIIEGIAKALFNGYNTARDLQANKGHKLINIDVPSYEGVGGDEKVPEHHPDLLIEAALKLAGKNRVVKLSINPGGTHVTNWWASKESREAVMDFFDKVHFLPDLKEPSTEFNVRLKPILPKIPRLESAQEPEEGTYIPRFLREFLRVNEDDSQYIREASDDEQETDWRFQKFANQLDDMWF